tara:strand:+ start:385 stop:591 length:207 start_codon:yes stop_codon:yes gene_type:complete
MVLRLVMEFTLDIKRGFWLSEVFHDRKLEEMADDLFNSSILYLLLYIIKAVASLFALGMQGLELLLLL